jgi:hypothetical protein
MPADAAAATRFVLSTARLLDRHRLAFLLGEAPAEPVLDALRAYRTADGGFGHALEPDVRGPGSEPASVLHALDVLAEVGALDDPMVPAAAEWIANAALPDGGIPFVTPHAANYPHAPWMVHSPEGSFLTFALAARLWEAGGEGPWIERATAWCWQALEQPAGMGGYWLKFALDFLDHVPEDARARAAVDALRGRLDADGSVPVAGGTDDERITALVLSVRPGARSRALFEPSMIERDLDELERAQQADGGWNFDWLAWSAGQEVEWRGAVTLRALRTLREHDRI